jgi:GGDEF domain-containing protein
LIDLDKFKEVNDTYGHKAGDMVLIHFSNVLTSILRKTDFIARLGGDEFVVLLCDMSDQEKAIEIASKIITEACRPIDIGHGISASTGASIGINYASGTLFRQTNCSLKRIWPCTKRNKAAAARMRSPDTKQAQIRRNPSERGLFKMQQNKRAMLRNRYSELKSSSATPSKLCATSVGNASTCLSLRVI